LKKEKIEYGENWEHVLVKTGENVGGWGGAGGAELR
jgi:hypothetical protein